MKKLIMPKVVEFNLKDRVADVLAYELFNIVRNQGTRFESTKTSDYMVKSEEHVNHQFDRLRKYAAKGEIEKFDFLATRLLKNSKAFIIYSINHTFHSNDSMRTTKLIKLIKKVMEYARNEETKLSYKRTWIDKKLNDYGRPLGIPEAADRVYGHMITRIMEAYLTGTNQYSPMQHGGVPGRGVMTFLIELADRVKNAPRIFEFDIKGYFDHINHDVILDMFKSQVILKYLKGALTSEPKSFTLPPIDHDLAVQTQRNLIEVTESILDDLEELMGLPLEEGETDPADILFMLLQDEGDSAEVVLTKLMDELNGFIDAEVPLSKIYELQMKGIQNPSLLDYLQLEDYSEQDRAQGRDSWKDLNLKGKGVPQGSNFGPVVASVLLGKVMPRNSLLYMDDGLVFCKEKVLKGEVFSEIANRVKKLGCELAPEKSRMLRTKDLMAEGFKIVGTRWQQTRNYFNYTVSSETRKGLKRKLFPEIKDNYLEILCDLYKKGYISASKHKMLRWYLDKGELKRIPESSLFSLSEKIGIFGNILSKAYSPTTSLEEMKEEIEYGIFLSKMRKLRAKGSLAQRLLTCGGVIAVECSEKRSYVKPNIHNVRCLASEIMLRYIKGELPERKLRVQGLRKPFKLTK